MQVDGKEHGSGRTPEKHSPSMPAYYRKRTSIKESNIRPSTSAGRLRLEDGGYGPERLTKVLDDGLRSTYRRYSKANGESRAFHLIARDYYTNSPDIASVGSTARREDARQMFKEFGITRPQGWLSEAGSDGRELHKLSELRIYQICHSCKVRMTSQKICSDCGHESCVKCTDEERYGLTQDIDSLDTGVTQAKSKVQETVNIGVLPKEDQSGIEKESREHQSVEVPGLGHHQEEASERQKVASGKVPHGLPPGVPGRGRGASFIQTNPFVLADQKAKAVASAPETSTDQAEAWRATKVRECIPQRKVESPALVASDRESDNASHSGLRDTSRSDRHNKGFTSRREALKEIATHNNSLTSYSHDDDAASIKDPLQKKIDQLYHHAQDLYSSQHIMEHLAAGSGNVKNEEERSHHAVERDILKSKEHNDEDREAADSQLHSWAIDRPEDNQSQNSDATNALVTVQSQKESSVENQPPVAIPKTSNSYVDVSEKPHQPDWEVKAEAWPRLKAVEKKKSKEQLQEPNTASQARQSLRKITPPTISRKAHHRRSKACYHCDPSEESPSHRTTSEHDQRVPHLVLPDDGIGYDHGGVSETRHRREYSEWDEYLGTSSRMRVRDLELSMATHSVDDLLTGSAGGRQTPSILEPLTELPDNNDSTPQLHEPKASLPPDHACEWRARCMDLSSEVDALRSEMEGSQDSVGVHRNESAARPAAAQIDVGVGGDLVCDDFGIEGLTIVMHLRGKDDLVINTDIKTEGTSSEA
ncbi:hypothetical protein N3K66_001843 [Trichothecium roseum]|uniref:Uncharacterized protein n=1 Tax=Trichothecium roseum TaxID=47278 RepID=A0ACC0V7Y2_9HYPO|nr:hypothetical protein N3K66_001843 [Trichothecium roseum]